ncbi:hypothetical protein ACQZV8_03930 [Magnetococcales bacterium HHB-1]
MTGCAVPVVPMYPYPDGSFACGVSPCLSRPPSSCVTGIPCSSGPVTINNRIIKPKQVVVKSPNTSIHQTIKPQKVKPQKVMPIVPLHAPVAVGAMPRPMLIPRQPVAIYPHAPMVMPGPKAVRQPAAPAMIYPSMSPMAVPAPVAVSGSSTVIY